MQTACTHCGAEHSLKETELSGHSKVQFRCSKCGKSTVVQLKRRSDATVVMSPLPSFARAAPGGLNLHSQAADPSLKLPAAANVILRIMSGPSQGKSHTLTKPRVVLGREGADIAVEDPEISRHHCLLEVRDTYINLKDRSEEHTSELQSQSNLVCRLLLEKKKKHKKTITAVSNIY